MHYPPALAWGWSGGAMVLGKLPVPGRPTIWITVGQGPTALAVGAGGGCLDIFTLIYPFSPLSPSLWETARYRLKYCLKGPLNPKQPTNPALALVSASTFTLYLLNHSMDLVHIWYSDRYRSKVYTCNNLSWPIVHKGQKLGRKVKA